MLTMGNSAEVLRETMRELNEFRRRIVATKLDFEHRKIKRVLPSCNGPTDHIWSLYVHPLRTYERQRRM